jgi:hypothetical protein
MKRLTIPMLLSVACAHATRPADEVVTRSLGVQPDSLPALTQYCQGIGSAPTRYAEPGPLAADDTPPVWRRPETRDPTVIPPEPRPDDDVVTLRFIVGADGRPDMCSVRLVATNGVTFVPSATALLSRSTFEPARHAGVPRPAWMQQTFAF